MSVPGDDIVALRRKMRLDSSRTVANSSGATRSVVEFLVVLDKLLNGLMAARRDAPPHGRSSCEQPEHLPPCACAYADARYSALWDTLSCYQPSVHGRSPGTLLAVNLAWAWIQDLPDAHLRRLLISDPRGWVASLLPADQTSMHGREDRELHVAAIMSAFYGHLRGQVRLMFRMHLNVNLLREWVEKCPALQRGVCAVRSDGGSAVASDDETILAPPTQERHRCMAFHVAVVVYALAQAVKQVEGLLSSLAHVASTSHISGDGAVDPNSLPSDSFNSNRNEGDDAAVLAATVPGESPDTLLVPAPRCVSLSSAFTSLSTAVSTMLVPQVCAALVPLYRTVATELLLAGDTPDAVGWLLCQQNLLAPSSPHGDDTLLVLSNAIRSCQSAEMLTNFILWVALGLSSSPTAVTTAAQVDTRALGDPSVAAQHCVAQATEHCLALMISSQLILQECDSLERSRTVAGRGLSMGGKHHVCPLCCEAHPPTTVCEGGRQRIALAICESLIASLVTFTEKLCSDGVPAMTTFTALEPQRAQAALQAAVDLVSVSTRVCQMLQSHPLSTLTVFSRTYDTEQQLLRQQQTLCGASSASLNGDGSRKQRPTFVLAQSSSGFLADDHRSGEPMEDNDWVSSSPSSRAASSPRSCRMSSSEGGSRMSFLSTQQDREVDGMYLLRPPAFSTTDVDVLRSVALDNGGDVLKYGKRPDVHLGAALGSADDAVMLPYRTLHVVLSELGSALRCPTSVLPSDQAGLWEMFEPALALASKVDRIRRVALSAIEDPTTLLAAAAAATVSDHQGETAHQDLLEAWASLPLHSHPLESIPSFGFDEPVAFFSELQAAVAQAQELLASSTSDPMWPPQRLADGGLAVKRLLDRYRSTLHGRAPSTLQQLSLACGTTARLLREGRRRLMRMHRIHPSSSPRSGASSSFFEQQQSLVLAETDLVNRAVAYQKRVLALSHLEPATCCTMFMERAALCFGQCMWLSASHEYAVAERVLATRQDAVRRGFHRLQALMKIGSNSPLSIKEAVDRFQQEYARVLAPTTTSYASPTVAASTTPPTTPTSTEASAGRSLSDVLTRLRYNTAVALWCGGHAEDCNAWLQSALGTTTPPADLSRHPQVVQLCFAVGATCRLMLDVFSGDGVDGLLYFLGSLSSEVRLNPGVVAGALVLSQHVVERYLSLRACKMVIGSIDRRGGNICPSQLTMEAQSRCVAAISNHVVVQLSTGKISDINVVLRNGLPPGAAHWDKLLVHAIVTCMNFCSAFPDSVWYEAVLHNLLVCRPPGPQTAVSAEAVSPTPRPSTSLSWNSPTGDAPNSGESPGILQTISKTFSSIFGNRASRPQQELQQQSTTEKSGPSHAAVHVDSFQRVRIFFERDMKRSHTLLAELLEWAASPPLVAIREDEMRTVAVQLDEAMLELQTLLEGYGGPDEAEAFVAELRKEAEHAVRSTETHAPPARGLDDGAADVGCSDASFPSPMGIVMSPAVSPPRPFYTSPHVAAVEAPPTSVGYHNTSLTSLQVTSSSVVSTSDGEHQGLFVPDVLLDKLGETTALALSTARRTKAFSSVYSPILPGGGRQHDAASSSGVSGFASTDALTMADTSILSHQQRAALHQQLPMHFQLLMWRNVYSTKHHGTSFRTLLSHCEGEQPLLLLLETFEYRASGTVPASQEDKVTCRPNGVADSEATGRVVIGAFIPNGISLGHQKYFGGADTFVFRVEQEDHSTIKKRGAPVDGASPCVVYRWTHENQYFLNCRMDYLAIGGGAHGAAIYLDDTLASGSTSRCATFASPPLVAVPPHTAEDRCEQSVPLNILSVEIYAIGTRAR